MLRFGRSGIARDRLRRCRDLSGPAPKELGPWAENSGARHGWCKPWLVSACFSDGNIIHTYHIISFHIISYHIISYHMYIYKYNTYIIYIYDIHIRCVIYIYILCMCIHIYIYIVSCGKLNNEPLGFRKSSIPLAIR